VGVTAYNGAAPLLANKALLTAAAAIHNVEAYHAGIIRSLLFDRKDEPIGDTTVGAVANGIAALRDTLDAGTTGSDAGITEGAAFVLGPFDTNGLVIPRTAEQVTRIVTAGATGEGLFFPNGLNKIFAVNTASSADQAV
jgi:Ferritin-like domain